MTDTTHTTEVPANGTSQQVGTLEQHDPALLEIGENVRDDAALSKSFIASIAENGVLVPITGVRNADNPGVVHVRNGQRRTLAAREIGLAPFRSTCCPPAPLTPASRPSTASCTRSSPTIKSTTSPTPSGPAAPSR